MAELILRLDDGQELAFEPDQAHKCQHVYIRKKVAEIGLSMKGSPHGPSNHYEVRIQGRQETKHFLDHEQAVDWLVEKLGLEV